MDKAQVSSDHHKIQYSFTCKKTDPWVHHIVTKIETIKNMRNK